MLLYYSKAPPAQSWGYSIKTWLSVSPNHQWQSSDEVKSSPMPACVPADCCLIKIVFWSHIFVRLVPLIDLSKSTERKIDKLPNAYWKESPQNRSDPSKSSIGGQMWELFSLGDHWHLCLKDNIKFCIACISYWLLRDDYVSTILCFFWSPALITFTPSPHLSYPLPTAQWHVKWKEMATAGGPRGPASVLSCPVALRECIPEQFLEAHM